MDSQERWEVFNLVFKARHRLVSREDCQDPGFQDRLLLTCPALLPTHQDRILTGENPRVLVSQAAVGIQETEKVEDQEVENDGLLYRQATR